jgi:hypothetical protein
MILTFADDVQIHAVNDGSVNWKLFYSKEYNYLFLECGVNGLEEEQLDELIGKIKQDSEVKSILIFAPYLLNPQSKVIGERIRDQFNLILFHINGSLEEEIIPDHIFTLIQAKTPETGYAQALKHLTGDGSDSSESFPVDFKELDNDSEDEFDKAFKGIKAKKPEVEKEEDGVF